TPTLTDIIDSKGTVVGGSTVETSVTVTGTGSSGQQIQLLDGTANIGNPVPIPTDGTTWSTPLTSLDAKAYSLKAKALYDSGQESTPKAFNVVDLVTPTITSVRGQPSNAEIPNSGSTVETSVILTGAASVGLEVELFDAGTSKGGVTATGGTWTSTAIAVALGPHSFIAKGVYGTEPESALWALTVEPAIPELVIDPSPVTLNAVHHRSHVTPSNPPPGAYVDRYATGGVQPCAYYSDNPEVAEVGISSGRVISKGTGTAIITAYDQMGQPAAYTVYCSNVLWYFGSGVRGNYRDSRNAIQSQGGRIPTAAEYNLLRNNYSGINHGIGDWRNWILDPGGAPLGKKYVINPLNGQVFLISDMGDVFPFGSENADGFGVKGR
ncbi:hypothetical protein HU806_25215, partial [Pseudomonas sp. SWRI154]|nr:hypothetical protein [Pseudomonas sp. SWRI154]